MISNLLDDEIKPTYFHKHGAKRKADMYPRLKFINDEKGKFSVCF